jgi:gas vesicle protein
VAYFVHRIRARVNEEDDMADEVSTRVRTAVEKVLEADVTDQIARRGRELAEAVADATEAVSARAGDAWGDYEPQRREAKKAARRVSRDAMKWSRRTWTKELRPVVRDLWKRRSTAIGATAAAIPAGREIVEGAAARMGVRRRSERRHWTAFFIGLLLGAAAGAAIAILTTPKPGREMRDELAGKARETAGEWVPLFQREPTNGDVSTPVDTVDAQATSTEPIDTTPERDETI